MKGPKQTDGSNKVLLKLCSSNSLHEGADDLPSDMFTPLSASGRKLSSGETTAGGSGRRRVLFIKGTVLLLSVRNIYVVFDVMFSSSSV